MRIDAESLPEDASVPLQQHPAFARALSRLGRPADGLTLSRDGRTVGHALVLRRGRSGLISRGPVWAEGATPGDRRAALRALRRHLPVAGRLVVNAEAAAEGHAAAGFLPLLTAATVAEWDLSGDSPHRRAGLEAKWRNRLVRAEAAGWQLHEAPMPADPEHWLLARDAAQQRARGYRAWPAALVAAYAAANPGAALLFTAERDGAAAAAVLVLVHGRRATYQSGWTSEKGRRDHAHNLLLWAAAERLAERGVALFDLGTLDTVNLPGLARFKLGTGAAARALGGTWGTLRLF